MLVTNLIYWENHQHNVKSRQHNDFATKLVAPTSQISHHHKVTNITTSPTSLSPIFSKQQKDFTLDNFRNNLQFQIHFEWSSKMPFSKFKIKCLPKISSSAYNISRFNKLNFDLHRSVIKSTAQMTKAQCISVLGELFFSDSSFLRIFWIFYSDGSFQIRSNDHFKMGLLVLLYAQFGFHDILVFVGP